MKQAIIALILTLVLASQMSKADPVKAANLTDEQRRQIAWAIMLLVDTGAMAQDQNKCTKFDPDIIKDLFNQGLLKPGDSRITSICIGRTPQ